MVLGEQGRKGATGRIAESESFWLPQKERVGWEIPDVKDFKGQDASFPMLSHFLPLNSVGGIWVGVKVLDTFSI